MGRWGGREREKKPALLSPAMGKYETVAFEVLELAFGDRFVCDDSRIFSFGPDAGTGQVDGTIGGEIAVEIGVGDSKQIRASVLDLAFHPLPLKLLVTVDTPHHATERSSAQAAVILERLGCAAVVFRVEAGRDQEEMAGELAEAVDG
jgi:hypothetical protein